MADLPAGDYRIALPHDGLRRSYLLHVPPAHGPRPLILMVHGAGGSADFAAVETGWSRLADTAGFIVAYPEGVAQWPEKAPKFLTNPQEWNDGSGRGRHDDVGFLLAVIDNAVQLAAADRRRVFLTGFSNGAGMVFRTASEHADRIAAIGPVAGHCWIEPRPSRPIPTIYLVGEADPLVPLEGGPAKTPWGQVESKPNVRQGLARWGTAIGQQPGSDLFPVHFLNGLGHHWPGGLGMLDRRWGGPFVESLPATEEIWRFFARTASPA